MKEDGKVWLDSSVLGWGPVVGCFEHSHELLGLVEGRGFLG